MLLRMETTLDTDDSLLAQAKQVAAESHGTLTSVVQEALRADVTRRDQTGRSRERERALTSRGTGVRPGVNLDSMAELLDIMDGVE